MNRKQQPAGGGQPDGQDLDAVFRQAMDNDEPAQVDLDATPYNRDSFTQVCACGLDFLHTGRCARCAARNDRLVCGKPNNHRGPHQAIAIWRSS